MHTYTDHDLVVRGQEIMAKTLAMKSWAIKNHDHGAKVIVEHWADSDYQDVLIQNDFDLRTSIEYLEKLVKVYNEGTRY